MVDDLFSPVWLGLRAALIADQGLADALGVDLVDLPRRVLDHVPDNQVLPYVRLGRVEPVSDDTHTSTGEILQLGLEAYSRPDFGRIEVAKICATIKSAIHRQPETITAAGVAVSEIEVQTWATKRESDGGTWRGVVALQVSCEPEE